MTKRTLHTKTAAAVCCLVLAACAVFSGAVSVYAQETGSGVLAEARYGVNVEANKQEIFNYLTNNMGLNSAAACGVMANIERECDFDPTAVGGGGRSYGLCQWTDSRQTGLKNYCSSHGYDYRTINGQMHFLEYELSDSYYSHILKYLRSVSNTAQGAYDAGYYWCYHFEQPGDYPSVSVTRGNLARDKYWPVYGRTVTPAFQYGDLNSDGAVQTADAMLVLKSVVGSVSLSEQQVKAADVNGDGKANVLDALLILKRVVNSQTRFPVE